MSSGYTSRKWRPPMKHHEWCGKFLLISICVCVDIRMVLCKVATAAAYKLTIAFDLYPIVWR